MKKYHIIWSLAFHMILERQTYDCTTLQLYTMFKILFLISLNFEVFSSIFPTAPVAAAEKAIILATFSVPERIPFSCPPPRISGETWIFFVPNYLWMLRGMLIFGSYIFNCSNSKQILKKDMERFNKEIKNDLI